MRAVMRNDRDATGRQSLKDLTLGVSDRAFVGKEFGMRGRDRGDDRNVRAHQAGQVGEFAGMVHPHLEHARPCVARRAGKAQRYASVIVVALDGSMHRTRHAAVQRGEQRLLGAGLADRPGHADHDAGHSGAGGPRQIVERREGVGHEHMGTIRGSADDRPRRALRARLVEEPVPVGALPG